MTPHWEIPSYNNVQPNPVQGNRPYRSRPAYGVGYGYVGFPYYADPTAFVDAGSVDDGAAQGTQPQAAARPDYVPEQQYGEGEAGYPPPPRGAYPPQEPRRLTPAESAAAQSNGLDHPEVTLVFNDGRPAKKVRSYVLTSSAVFVSEDGRQTQIPIAALDVQATIEQNREAGVDFALPGGSR